MLNVPNNSFVLSVDGGRQLFLLLFYYASGGNPNVVFLCARASTEGLTEAHHKNIWPSRIDSSDNYQLENCLSQGEWTDSIR